MTSVVIADNWSLQEVSSLLTHGIDRSESSVIVVDNKSDTHRYENAPHAALAFEALFDLLTDIVLRDEIWIDSKFSNTWEDFGILDSAVRSGVIKPFNFLGQAQELVSPRNEFVDRMCVTKSLKIAHQENVRSWELHQQTPDKYLSQTLWGGAGMLARSFVYRAGYTPHPARKRLFKQTGIVLADNSAEIKLARTIHEKRADIYVVESIGGDLFSLQVVLPPLPAQIIREAADPRDLIPIALQLREEYKELRDWLSQYQEALNSGDFADLNKCKSVLRSISLYVDSLTDHSDSSASTFTVGIDAFKVAFKGSPLNYLKNQFGVRSMINKLITTRSGSAELDKLLDFYQHRGSDIGLKVLEHFAARDGK